MKKLLLLLFSILISFNSFAEWTRIYTDDKNIVYMDLNTLIKHNDYIYWWTMIDFLDNENSGKAYFQGDCSVVRSKILMMIYYSQLMGMGEDEVERTSDNLKWNYQPPDSAVGFMLDISCKLSEASAKEQQEILEEIQSKEELQKLREIEEAEAKAKEDLAKELELKLLDLQILVQEKNQEINKLDEIRASYKKDELLLSLLELEKLVQAEEQELNDLIALRAAKQEAFEKEQYNRQLTQMVQEEQDLVRSLIIKDQLNTLKSAYVNNIAAKVRNYWRYHQGTEANWGCDVYVQQDIDGKVEAVNIQNCNLDDSEKARAFKSSIERAVYKASPLPPAPDDAVFSREILFIFRAL